MQDESFSFRIAGIIDRRVYETCWALEAAEDIHDHSKRIVAASTKVHAAALTAAAIAAVAIAATTIPTAVRIVATVPTGVWVIATMATAVEGSVQDLPEDHWNDSSG